MYILFGLDFFNFLSDWFYYWPVMVMDVMDQKRNVNDMLFTATKYYYFIISTKIISMKNHIFNVKCTIILFTK